MIAVLFGIQGVGKSLVVNEALSNFTGDQEFKLLQWGSLTYDVALKTGIISVDGSKELGNFKVKKEDEQRGVKIIVKENGDELILTKDKESLILGRDEMRYLDISTQKKLQEAVVLHLAEEIKNDPKNNFLIETHAALKTLQGYLPGLPASFMNIIDPDLYIIIEASAQEIFNRRMNDKTRKRDHDKTVADVERNLELTRTFASIFTCAGHDTLCIVQNKEGESSVAAQEMVDVLKRFIK